MIKGIFQTPIDVLPAKATMKKDEAILITSFGLSNIPETHKFSIIQTKEEVL